MWWAGYRFAVIKNRILPTLLVAAMTALAAPSASAEPTTYISTGPVFNDPKDPGGVKQRAILSHLGRLVNGATPARPSGYPSTPSAPAGWRISSRQPTSAVSTCRCSWTTTP